MARETPTPPQLLSRNEAAQVLGLPLKAVDKAIEQGVVRVQRRRHQALVRPLDVASLLAVRTAGITLPVRTKKQVRQWVVDRLKTTSRSIPDMAVSDSLVIRFPPEVLEAVRRAERYVELRDKWIEANPGIKGGEPVIRNSRVGVYGLAHRMELGESEEILDEDYPHIPAEAREVALQYARAHPRRGRPKKPWRDV